MKKGMATVAKDTADCSDSDHRRKSLLKTIYLFLFSLSGAAALMYEVVWVRQLTNVLGNSSYAITIVLTAFMAGLAIGAWLLGKKADHFDEKRLIKAYVFLEAGIAASSLFLPLLFDLAEHGYVLLYHWFHPGPLLFNCLKIVLAFLVLIVPTTFIGATLPVLSRYLIRKKSSISLTISKLYALNTFGGILGTLGAGYFLLPTLGINQTTMLAIGINLLVAVAFWIINSLADSSAMTPPSTQVVVENKTRPSTPFQRAILIGFCVSGIAAMFYEIAWTRTLAMILGTTTFAFTTMLSTFLIGIALGSALYTLLRRLVSGSALFIVLQFVVAFSVLLSIPLLEKLPLLFLSLHAGWVETWMDMQYVRFLLSSLVMLVPTLAMGTLLPVVSSIFIEKTGHLGKRLGKAYGLNTLGNVIGAAIGGLLLVPAVGMQKTIMIGALLNISVGCSAFWFLSNNSVKRRGFVTAAASLASILLIFLIAPWAPRIINSGVYVYAPRYHNMVERYQTAAENSEKIPAMPSWEILEMAMKQYKLLYYDTGVAATVAVMERKDGVRFLTINGKTDASTGKKSDMGTQVMIAQLPLLFHQNPDKTLLVGLGSGVTAGSILTHDVRLLDCAEISPSVIEAARFFAKANHNVLDDKRLRIIPRDARNLLLTSEEKYDVIISQPSNPWISGESSLFALQWYQMVREHLENEGLFLQWVPSYLTAGRDVKTIIHTLRSVFPHLTVWTSNSLGDLIFLAKKGKALRVDYQQLLRRTAKKEVRNDILRVGLDPALLPFDLFVMNEEELSVYLYSNLTRPLRKNTDNLLITEFSTPKQLVRRKKVARFVEPDRLHGDLESLMEILGNITTEELNVLLRKKLDQKQEVIEDQAVTGPEKPLV